MRCAADDVQEDACGSACGAFNAEMTSPEDVLGVEAVFIGVENWESSGLSWVEGRVFVGCYPRYSRVIVLERALGESIGDFPLEFGQDTGDAFDRDFSSLECAAETAVLGLLDFDLFAIEGDFGVAFRSVDFQISLARPVASESESPSLLLCQANEVRSSDKNTLIQRRVRIIAKLRLPRRIGRTPIHQHDPKSIVKGQHSAALILQEADNQPSLSLVELDILAAIADRNLALLHVLKEELARLAGRHPKRNQWLSVLHTNSQHLCRRVQNLLRPSIEIRNKHLRLPTINRNMRRELRDCQVSLGGLDVQLKRLEAGQRGVGVLGDVEAGVVVDVVELLGEDGGVAGVVCRAVAALFDFGQIFGGAQEESEEFSFGVFGADGSRFGDGGAVVVACALFVSCQFGVLWDC